MSKAHRKVVNMVWVALIIPSEALLPTSGTPSQVNTENMTFGNMVGVIYKFNTNTKIYYLQY